MSLKSLALLLVAGFTAATVSAAPSLGRLNRGGHAEAWTRRVCRWRSRHALSHPGALDDVLPDIRTLTQSTGDTA